MLYYKSTTIIMSVLDLRITDWALYLPSYHHREVSLKVWLDIELYPRIALVCFACVCVCVCVCVYYICFYGGFLGF